MVSLVDIQFDYNGEKVWLVEYLDRMLGTPHPPRVTKREEELAVQNAIERPIIIIHRDACEQPVWEAADYIRSEIAQLVDVVRQYTWLSEDTIWKVAYEILLWKARPEE